VTVSLICDSPPARDVVGRLGEEGQLALKPFIQALGELPQHREWAAKNGGGVDVPGVSSTWGHEAGGTEQHGSLGPRRTSHWSRRPTVLYL
jgi:hypothetical protein